MKEATVGSRAFKTPSFQGHAGSRSFTPPDDFRILSQAQLGHPGFPFQIVDPDRNGVFAPNFHLFGAGGTYARLNLFYGSHAGLLELPHLVEPAVEYLPVIRPLRPFRRIFGRPR